MTAPTQKTIVFPSSPYTGAAFLGTDLPALIKSVAANRAGTSRPSDIQTGEVWLDTTTATAWAMKMYDGVQDVVFGYFNTSTHAYTPVNASAGDMLKSDNLSGLANYTTARSNMGLGSAAVLDTGTTASKVLQLDSSAKIPSVDGSQLTGMYNKIQGSFTHDLSVTGTQDINGLGFDPDEVDIELMPAGGNGIYASSGSQTGSNSWCRVCGLNGTAGTFYDAYIYGPVFASTGFSVNAYASLTWITGGFRLTWSKTGSPTGTVSCYYKARRR